MQHYNKKTFGEKFYIFVTGSVWVAGLLIAGSENDFMPWVNGAGLVLFLISSILLGKFFRQLENSRHSVLFPGIYQRSETRPEKSVKKNSRVTHRYVATIR